MRIILILLFLASATNCFSQNGKVVHDQITSVSLKNNAGENPTRRLTIYLPPGYDNSKQRYPVIYYLHAFTETDSMNPRRIHVLDTAISSGKIKPFILVVSDQKNLYEGSMYSNSAMTGNWGDFTAKDLVAYMEEHYRTIPKKEARGIAGHSMGAHGTLRIAMLYPGVFNAAYALSPIGISIMQDQLQAFKKLATIQTKEELQKLFLPKALVVMGRQWSPNPSKQPFNCDLPYYYSGDSMIVDSSALKKWNKNLLLTMLETHGENLKKLKALRFDWGTNDNERVTTPCKMLDEKMTKLGIPHKAEEYVGDHTNKIWTDDGRVLNELLPFFNSNLQFSEGK